jgi:SH3 domain-containing YSC84-like protein 1
MQTKLATCFVVTIFAATGALAADKEAKAIDRIDASADVVTDLLKASDHGVPQDLLDKAKCVVVIPGMKKAGFIIGANYGRGFAVCRKASDRGWSAPAAMRVEGGSVGFQIGGTSEDILLLVMNDGAMKHLLQDKFTLGGDAAVAAGPVGRTAAAETDAEMHAEMLTYSRSRGVFAGISLQGATMRPDNDTNQELYSHETKNGEILSGTVPVPAGAHKLDMALNANSHTRM